MGVEVVRVHFYDQVKTEKCSRKRSRFHFPLIRLAYDPVKITMPESQAEVEEQTNHRA